MSQVNPVLNETSGFPIICIGGSAGSMQPFFDIISHLPADLGVSVVIVNHARKYDTLLPSILARSTKMKVQLVTQGMQLEPNQIFIIPKDRDLSVCGRMFELRETSKPKGWPNVLTLFLDSLSSDWKGIIVGIVVSGFDSDGAAALRAFKSAGGITFAQSAETSEHGDMPAHAVMTGYVDYVLSAPAIANKLREMFEDDQH